MIEERVHFYADGLKLEGIITYQEDMPAAPAILLCSPHPNLGGDMDNNVVTGLAKFSADMGFMSLRFNYRGVGNSDCHEKDIAQKYQYWDVSLSDGNYGDAVADTRAALAFLSAQTDAKNGVFIAGYSFGAVVGSIVGGDTGRVNGFASISMPFGVYSAGFLRGCNKPKLFIYSQKDFATTVDDTIKGFAQIPPPKILELIEGSDHFYRDQETLISQKVCAFFQECLHYLKDKTSLTAHS